MRLFVLLALAGSSFAGVFTSAKSGNWSDPTTWGNPVGGAIPGPGDTVITNNYAVTVNGSYTVGGCQPNGSATAAVKIGINTGAELILATNAVLTLRGDLINGAKLTGAPGAQILFDPSCGYVGSDETERLARITRRYKLDFAYSGAGSSTFAATVNNHGVIKTLRPNGDELNAYGSASVPGTGGFRTLKYVDVTDFGDATHSSLKFSAQQNFDLDYGYNTFTRNGALTISIMGASVQGNGGTTPGWRIYNNTFTEPPTGAYSLIITNYSTNPGATDVREIKNNTFGGQFGIQIANTAWNVHHNVFLSFVDTAANTTLVAGWHDNLYFYAAGANGTTTHQIWGIPDFVNNYVANTVSDNGHVIYFPGSTTAAPLHVTITDNIFEGPNAPLGNGDLMGIGQKPTGYTIDLLRNLVLVNPESKNPGGHFAGNVPTTTTIKHNTIGISLFAGGGDAAVTLGEYQNVAVSYQRPGNISEIKSNIFFNPYGLSNKKVIDIFAPWPSGTSNTYDGGWQDIATPSGIGFNAGWNTPSAKLPGTVYPNAGNGYQFNISSPIANNALGPQSDLDGVDPGFRDRDRGLGWYWRKVLGHAASTSATPYLDDATSAVNYIAQDPETRIPAVMAWVKEGYQITNPALHNTAHDGGDVGAMPFYAPPPPPSTFVLITDGGSHLYRGNCGGVAHPCRLANTILALVPETGALFHPADLSAAYQLSATATHPGIHATFSTSSFNRYTYYRTAVYLTADADVPPGKHTVTFTMAPIVGGTTPVSSKPFPLIVSDPPGPLTRVANPTSNPPPARYYDQMQRALGIAAKFCHQYSPEWVSAGVPNTGDILNPGEGPYYYDGIKVYYDLYDLTGDQQWKDCAAWQAEYVGATGQENSINNAFYVEGLYRHWSETGSTASLGVIADRAMRAYNSVLNRYYESGGTPDIEYYRIAALALNTTRIAVHANMTQYIPTRDLYEEMLLTEFDAVVSGNNRNHVKSWMMGLMIQALISYYEDDTCYPDPRIPAAVKKMADYLWQNTWVDDSNPSNVSMGYVNGMHYTTVSPIFEWQPVPKAAPVINMLLAPAYSWIYKHTGDVAYLAKYDKMREGWVPGMDAGLGSNAKIFGESFRWDLEARKYLDDALLPTVLAADTTNPTVSITASQTGTVSGLLTITATADDNVGIAGVEVFIRPDASANVGNYSAAAGWGAGWDVNVKYLGRATASGSGTFTLEFDINKYTAHGVNATIYAVAYDKRRNYKVSNSLTITPSNPRVGDTTPPNIVFGSGTFAGGSGYLIDGIISPIMRLKTDADVVFYLTDNTSTFFYWQVWVDSDLLCGDLDHSTYVNTYSTRATTVGPTCHIPATTMPLGPHTLTVYAWDEAGNQATFTQMLVIMDMARAAPGLVDSIYGFPTGPLDSQGQPTSTVTFNSFNIVHGQTLSGTVPLTASASDPNGIYGVQYYVDDIPVGSIVTTPPYTYNWDSRGVPSGQHRISAYASNFNLGWGTALALDPAGSWYAPWAVVPMRYVYVQNSPLSRSVSLGGRLSISGKATVQK